MATIIREFEIFSNESHTASTTGESEGSSKKGGRQIPLPGLKPLVMDHRIRQVSLANLKPSVMNHVWQVPLLSLKPSVVNQTGQVPLSSTKPLVMDHGVG